ncbi:E3 ubiquitin-protein ligase RBBP6 isoform X2 [Mastacembelus armatus]|uniref:E3 ubiquitin-protein ligase RBBP6 isoform X2 n=1 Tax=Mastacembelus armatus TaxID=205130 RepID=UPI000E460C9E|nr:E3 ubiquitin-protein ligase RBBP6 isoform X2 [Mastacembelus armatus]
MTHVHYKFSSKLSYDTVVFDGPYITLKDLKRKIMGREKLRAGDCGLQITNAQSKQEYTDDEGLISKGSSVIVRRIPISGEKPSSSSKTHSVESSDSQLHRTLGSIKAMVNLAEADVSEEDKISVMMSQSAYDSMIYNKKFDTVLPANYTCYRCGNTGHHIRNCPISGHDKNFEAPPRIKKSTGIPRSFMVEVDDPNMKGAMLTNCGRYAIPAIDAEAYAIGKKEKPPFIPEEKPKLEVKEIPVPDELVCLICHDLLSDAVVIPCCGNSYCDDCIRSTLLDSEDHVCPTCSQSSVSPDTLIANKFLRQAVNNFKKERGYSQSLTRPDQVSQSQHPTPKLSLVPTPPLLTVQIQPQKPHPPTYSQEDSLLHRPKVADIPPLSGPPAAAAGPSPAYSTPSTSCQPQESHLEIHDKEAKTQEDLAASASPSVLVSNEEPSAAPLQLIPVVNHRTVAEQPKTVGVKQQHASITSRHPGPSSCWDSSSSSSACPTRGWTESQQLTPYSATMPPLFPSPLFLPAHQSASYPPGYPHGTPIWTLPNPQGAPIPSLCSSTSTSSTPVLFSSEWYRHQRKKQRSPPRGSTYRRSSSRSHPKSSKSKSSCSYSRSSSRSGSRSRSRSQGRSRPRSPYTRHRDLHTHSYSYSYKRSRSPTPSSSSSPQTGRYSRSRSPPDKKKNRHQIRHQSKKSGSSSYSSRRREDSGREVGSSDTGSANYLYTQRTNQTANPELDTVRYLQWKKEYDEWCEKYFSSYVGHFHQPPLPSFMLPPPPQFGKKEQSKNHLNVNPDSHYQPQSRRTARVDSRSPSLQSSSDSRSPPSQSSSDSHSTSSQSFSDSRSSPSHTSNDSRSPPSQSPSDGRSTPSEDRAELRVCQEKCSQLPVTLTKSREDLKERSKDDRQVNMKPVEDLSTLKYDQRRIKKHEEERREESSFPDAAGSTGYSQEDERGHGTGPNACRDDTTVQSKTSDSETLKSIQPSLKPNKSLDKDCERKSREQRGLEAEKGWRRSKDSDLRQNVEKQQKVKPSEEADRHRKPGGRKASDTESEKNRKKKGEAIETSEIYKSDSPNPFDRKKPFEKKKERKTEPLTERDIWEGGMNVKPLKKISININLDGKMKEEKPEKESSSYSESVAGKPRGETENTGNGEEKLISGDTEAEKESSREKKCVFEEKIKPGELEAREIWEKGSFTGDQGEMWAKFPGEENNTREKNVGRGEEDFDLWHCALRGLEEEESKSQWEEKERMEVSKGHEVARDKWRSVMGKDEEKEGVCSESQGRYEGVTERQNELIQVSASKWEKEESQEGATTAQDRLPVAMPPPLLVPTIQETEGENELKRQRSVESERDRARALQTGREKEKYNSVAPSSGKDRTDSTLGTDRERDRWMESQRDRERERHRQRESKTSKERRDEERWRDRDRERGHSKMASSERWNLPSSSHCSSSSTSHDTERQDRQRGGDQGGDKNSSCPSRKSSGGGRTERSALSRAATLPDQSAHKTYRDMLLDSRCKNYPQDYYNHHDPSWNYRPAGVHRSPSPHSHIQGKDRDPLPKSSSPGWELTVNNQNKSKEEKGEWKQIVVEVIKESKEERETREMQAEREGGNRWKGGRELEEGERSSSRSSSGSQKSTDDVRREKKKKQKKEKKEKRRATPELLEEGELKIHKKSKKNRMRADEESGGEVDDRWKEEEDHAQPSSVLLS